MNTAAKMMVTAHEFMEAGWQESPEKRKEYTKAVNDYTAKAIKFTLDSIMNGLATKFYFEEEQELEEGGDYHPGKQDAFEEAGQLVRAYYDAL